MALAEVDGLRLLFDPLLDDCHHGGVFEVVPPRELDEAALRPDFIFVSHRHPDHFDLRSLRRLASRDPDAVVITPDRLVERACLRLGFRTVRVVPPSTRVDLDTVSLVTTSSRANDAPIAPEALEFGVAIRSGRAVVWNRVDTTHRDLADLRRELAAIEEALSAKLALALVPWCPLLEIEATTAGRIGFPFASYGALLEDAALLATHGATIVPSSAGARHAAPWSAMNALVYPVDEARFLRDLALRGASALPSGVGGVFVVEGDGVTFESGSPLVTTRPFVDDRSFAPLSIPPLFDPNARNRSESELRARIDAWVCDVLAPATSGGGRRAVLEVVYPSGRDVWSLREGVAGRGDDPSWDLRNQIAASLLCEVLDGIRHWGDVLLAGALRGCSRAYDIGERGLVRANVSPIFLYEALSYTASVERAVEYELSQ